MSNFKTTDFLNLRKKPIKEVGNIVAVLPPDSVVEELNGETVPGWLHVKAAIGNTLAEGYASQKFLQQTDSALPQAEQEDPLPRVHYPAKNRVIARSDTQRICPLNEPGLITFDLSQVSSVVERCAQFHNVINFLDVEHSARYAPNSENTYCNIYAYDVAFCLGAFLPRVWWTGDAIIKLRAGQQVDPVYDRTVTEFTANRIADWFEKFGTSFGWKRFFDLTVLQNAVNQGNAGIIVGQRINMNNPGHIDVVVPETEALKAKRTGDTVISPLQSQAGSRNRKYFTNNNWWEDKSRFKKFGFWAWPNT